MCVRVLIKMYVLQKSKSYRKKDREREREKERKSKREREKKSRTFGDLERGKVRLLYY